MPNQHAAYHMVEAELAVYCKKLLTFPPSVFWIHETVVSNFLGIPTGRGAEGQSDALTSLIACIKNGYGGRRRGNQHTVTSLDATDLKDQDNALGVCFQQYGKKELFQRGELDDAPVERSPRWFHFGKDFPIRVREQLLVVNQLTGQCDPRQLGQDGKFDTSDPAVLPIYTIRRRQKLFKSYFRGEGGGIPYKNFDVPAIAVKFRDMIWDNIVMSSTVCRRWSFLPKDLDFIEEDFRIMLVASNVVGKFTPGDETILKSISLRSACVPVFNGVLPSRNVSTKPERT